MRWLLWAVAFVRDWHYRRARAYDTDVLWPILCEEVMRHGDGVELDVELARALFYVHCTHDPAWQWIGVPAILAAIKELEIP